MNPKEIKIEHFSYILPEERIAKYPLLERDSSKLLLYKNNNLSEEKFYNLSHVLPKNSHLVFNNSKVVNCRLLFRTETGASIELFCLEPTDNTDPAIALNATHKCIWKCLVGNAKRWKADVLEIQVTSKSNSTLLRANKVFAENGFFTIEFTWDNDELTFGEILHSIGELPIPPYLKRDADERDKVSYQTIYAKQEGSVAAPTAGLHFTENVLTSLLKAGITKEEITLHVGAGTFIPVKSEQIGDHEMHIELVSITKSNVISVLHNLNNIIAVGTTSVRTLESLYYLGCLVNENPLLETKDLFIQQWMPYEKEFILSVDESLKSLIHYFELNKISTLLFKTSILIVPGFTFRIVKGLITNFHQPKSTLLLLIAAFAGNDWKSIYDFALENQFRFLSFGDSSLLLPS